MKRAVPEKSVTERLRHDILSGDLPPKTRLVELQLTERYGEGRASIRSAIVELVKEGLVTHEPNRGATVRALSMPEVIEVYEALGAIAALMAGHAAERALPSEREALRALVPRVKEARDAGRQDELNMLDRELHEQIVKIGRHRTARELLERLRNQSHHYASRIYAGPVRSEESFAAYTAIVDAIVGGDRDGAAHAVRAYMGSIIAALQ